jgi:hypothetical protein
MRENDRFADIVRKDLSVRAGDGTYDRMRETVLNAHGTSGKSESAATLIFTRRPIMRNPIARLAVAAAILVAVGLGMFAFVSTGSHSGVVWAQVAPRVNANSGFVYRTRTVQTRSDLDRPIEITTMTSNCPARGGRVEGIEGSAVVSYISYDEGTMVTLFHDMKRYIREGLPPLTEGSEADLSASDVATGMIRQFTAGQYKELGRKVIHGVEAEGIETHDPAGFMGNFQVDSRTAQLWVSVETGYPILIESHTVGNNGTLQIKTIIDEFQWDVEFDPGAFTTTIPADYQPLELLPGGGMAGSMGGPDDGQ